MQKGLAQIWAVTGIFILLVILILLPLPHYNRGPCLMVIGVKCPGWVLGDPLYIRIKNSFINKSSFVDQNPNFFPIPKPTPTLTPYPVSDCKITGCSRQVCSDQDVITTCEFRAEYACYENAICEKQSDGKCGWTKTEELNKCLEEKKSPKSYPQ